MIVSTLSSNSMSKGRIVLVFGGSHGMPVFFVKALQLFKLQRSRGLVQIKDKANSFQQRYTFFRYFSFLIIFELLIDPGPKYGTLVPIHVQRPMLIKISFKAVEHALPLRFSFGPQKSHGFQDQNANFFTLTEFGNVGSFQ